jgi:hypothetical protein
MEVDTVRFPGDMYEVLKWAVNRQLKEIPTEFEAWLLGLMPEKCREVTGHHLNVHTPQTPCVDGWVKGYPHSHVWSVNWPPDTYTCVTFLTMSDEGGEFALGGNKIDDPYETFMPEAGTTVTFDAMRWHGVRPVTRGTRISLLTSGFPDWEDYKRRKREHGRDEYF